MTTVRRTAPSRTAALARYVLVLCLVSTGMPGGRLAWAADEARILFRSGDLFAKPDKGERKAVPADQTGVPATGTIENGVVLDAAAQVQALRSPPPLGAVLSYSPREVVTLASGASVHRIANDAAKPSYTLAGPVHLLIHGPQADGKDPQPLHVTVNGVALETAEAHLFFDGWTTPARLTIVSGTAVLPDHAAKTAGPAEPARAAQAAGAKEGAGKPEAEKPAGPLTVAAGQVLVLDPNGPTLLAKSEGGKAEPDAARLKWSTLAGFEAPGTYKPAGVAVPSDDKLTLKRNGVESKLQGKRIPVMEGDELLLPAKQKVELLLDSKDKIVLTGEAKFKLERFAAKNVAPAFVFNVLGKVRALIAPKEPGSVQVKAVTAIIGVKGTDFETLASPSNTDVSVLEGKVGVGDATGAGEVEVPAGHFTSVAAGGKPLPPKPLPPERLKELREEAPAPTAINISGPAEGALLSGAKLEFTVDPPSAAFEVLLDDKPLPDFKSGSALPELPDGAHKVTVRGTASGALSKTVGFTVDRKPPALEPGVALAALTVVEGQPPVVLKWNKPLASVEAVYDGKTLPLTLGGDGQSAALSLDPAALKDVSTAIRIKATDKAGNAATSEGMLTFKRKPSQPPVLTANIAGPEWITNTPVDLKVSADRDIEKWEVLVGAQNVTERVAARPQAAKDAKPPKDITLSAALLLSVGDGAHPISIKATDSFGLVGEYRLAFTLDRAAPTLTAKNAKNQEPVNVAGTLKPGKYEFGSAKPLKELHVRMDDQEVRVALNPARTGFTLDAEGLKPGEHSYKLVFSDLAGNPREVGFKVVVSASAPPPAAATAAPVATAFAGLADPEGSLRKAYERSAATESGNAKDEMYVGERSQFVFINIKSGAAGAQLSGKSVYSLGKPSTVAKDVPEAFMREVSEE